MTRGAAAFSAVSTAKLLALVVLASAVGPLLDWTVWPTSKEVEQGFREGIVNLLWPTKIPALGAPSLSRANVALLALTNTLLYFVACGAGGDRESSLGVGSDAGDGPRVTAKRGL